MILDYDEFIIRTAEEGLVNSESVEKNIELFYKERGECPFCKIKTHNIMFESSKHSTPEWLFGTFDENEFVIQCPICSWWEYVYSNESDAIIDGIRARDLEIKTAVLRKYDISSKHVPIQTLNDYIFKNPDKIYGIHHKKMEELVQTVFRTFYNCEVELVGKSHDGGKDLILINSDYPTIIQVKRRTKAKKVEPVSSNRELLGATLLSQSNACIFVTTADHFSKMAVDEAEKAKKISLVQSYELIDYHRFIDILKLQNKSGGKPWERLIKLK